MTQFYDPVDNCRHSMIWRSESPQRALEFLVADSRTQACISQQSG